MTTYRTKVLTFDNEKDMNRTIKRMERRGWKVVNTEVIPGRYGLVKTAVLGAVFLPLALAGKKKPTHKVTFQKPDSA